MSKSKPLQTESPTEWLSLDDYVTGESDSILYIRVKGEPMQNVGINTGDLAVVDRCRQPTLSDVVLCDIGGPYTLKTNVDAKTVNNPLRLIARNGAPVEAKKENKSFEIVGVVTHVLRL